MTWTSLRRPLGKRGRRGPVHEARGEDGLLGGASAALDEAARDLADRVLALLVVAREREEVHPFAGVLAHGGDAEDDRLAHSDEDGTARLLGDAAGLEVERLAADLEFMCVDQMSSLFWLP